MPGVRDANQFTYAQNIDAKESFYTHCEPKGMEDKSRVIQVVLTGGAGLFVVGPHPQDFHCFFLYVNLIDQTVLYVYAPGICSLQVTHKGYKRGWSAERVFFDDAQ